VAEPNKPTELAVPTTQDGMRALLRQAGKGDTATLPTIRKLLENPENIDLLGGNLARCAEVSFAKAIAGEDLAVQTAIEAKLKAMRKELLGESPSPVEVLLVSRAVACWLQVQDADIRYAQAQGDLTIKQADYHQPRMDAANRRYLAALRTLAQVRKFAVPALQVNIAKKQVNVVTPASASPAG